MRQNVEYTVTMVRPDQSDSIVRKLLASKPATVVSRRQLAGYLTHTLFADRERGDVGTFYTVQERINGVPHVFTVERTAQGMYLHS